MPDQKVMPNEQFDVIVNVVFLSYGLACQQLAEVSNLTPVEWSDRLKAQAMDLITNDEYREADIEAIMSAIFPNA